jgi:hypothetical protein
MIELFVSEINDLSHHSSSFYYLHDTAIKKHVYVSFLAILNDQPERRKNNGLMMGNSGPSCRWGYFVANMNDITHLIPACSACQITNMLPSWSYLSEHTCLECFNWDSTNSGQARKLTYTHCLDILSKANEISALPTSNFSEVRDFVVKSGLNSASATHIWEHAENVKLKQRILETTSESDQSERETLLESMNGPKYHHWRGLPYWCSVTNDIEDFPDVPMHLLFLGIVKTTLNTVHSFIKQNKVSTIFETLMKRTLSPIIREYKLDWLVLMEFKMNGSTDSLESTSWVSENFLAFSRILKWFVSSLRGLNDRNTYRTRSILKKPIKLWKKNDLLMFSERHSILDTYVAESSKPVDLRRIITEYIRNNQNAVNSHVEQNDTSRCTVEDIIKLASGLHDFLHATMCPFDILSSRNKIERHVRIFLTQLHKIASNLGTTDIFMSTWNAQSLLNLGQMIERFGLSNLWEGGLNGEGMIQRFKAIQGILGTQKWPLILETVLKKRALQLIIEKDCVESQEQRKQAHRYQILHLHLMLSRRYPISVLWDASTDTRYVIVNTEHRSTRLCRILCTFMFTDDIARWYDITVDTAIVETIVIDMDHLIAQILMPAVHLHAITTKDLYCVISSDWSTQ